MNNWPLFVNFQLTCVGGSAKGMFVPQTVQCYNRGSDGYDIQVRTRHQENVSVQRIPPIKPHFYSKTGVCGGIPIFLIFALKHRLYVPTIYVLSKNKKKITFFPLKFSFFTDEKNLHILNGLVFVINNFANLFNSKEQLMIWRGFKWFFQTALLHQIISY